MKQVIILSGIPGSGKTTWALDYYSKNSIILSSDDIRFECLPEGYYHPSEVTSDKTYNQWVEQYVWSEYEQKFKELLIDGLEVKGNVRIVLDATHNQYRWWKKWRDIAKSYDYEIVGVDFQIPLKEALRRDKKRERQVGQKVITRMYNQKQSLIQFKHEFDTVIQVYIPMPA